MHTKLLLIITKCNLRASKKEQQCMTRSQQKTKGTTNRRERMADIGIIISPDPPHSPIPTESLIVDQESAKELQCGICLQLLNKPRQCKNGHLFCLHCISQCLEKGHECPSCRCSLKMEELARSLFVEKRIFLSSPLF